MNTREVLDPQQWAERTFGGVPLHDLRRTRRAVKAASNLAEDPVGSLPAQMHTWKETRALYRLLDEPDVNFAALMHPHLQQTREQAMPSPVVLLVQDTTDIDLSHRHKISGVGQIGNGGVRGFLVHVEDRGADMFPFFQACQTTQTHFLLRAGKSRRVQENKEEITYSLTRTRAFPSQASRPSEGPARHRHQARSAQVQLAFGHMTLLPPRNEPRAGKDPATVWVIRVWEEQVTSGKVGSLCKRFLKAFTLLFISVCNMWVRISFSSSHFL